MEKALKPKLYQSIIYFLLAGTIFSVVLQKLVTKINWPAFNTSNVTPTMCTALVTICLLAIALILIAQDRLKTWVKYTSVGVLLSVFTTSLLALPLGATRLYLMGISVDQQFRTEYLTRFADSPKLADMTYPDIPPFYPPTWFWIGGRLAHWLQVPAWEFYKPFAITSITVTILLALWLWCNLVDFTKATLLTVATSITLVQFNAFEPYGACIAILMPPILMWLWRGLSTPKLSLIILPAIFLGISATVYTLYTLITALAILVSFIYCFWFVFQESTNRTHRRKNYLLLGKKALLMLLISGAIALTTWFPYLHKYFTQPKEASNLATRYLPSNGSHFLFPMFEFNLWGVLSWLGLYWLIRNFLRSSLAKSIVSLLVAVYFWDLLSMLATLKQTTLLGFRTEPLIYLAFALAGVLCLLDLIQHYRAMQNTSFTIFTSLALLIGGIVMAENVPDNMTGDIISAYQDTDGYGHRGDTRPAGVEQYYPQINEYIAHTTNRPAHDHRVLTTDYSFLSLYPYWGFQNLTPHYANPLAQFSARNEQIQTWANCTTAQELIKKLQSSPWAAPDIFIFRNSNEGYQLRLSTDRYPNDPNVKRFYVNFPKNLFLNPHFHHKTIGPFEVFISNFHP